MEIALAVLIILNWLIYHNIFDVYYFGGMRKSLTSEFIWCSIIACIEMAIFITVGKWLLKWAIIIVAIVAVAVGVWKFFEKRKETDQKDIDEKENTTSEERAAENQTDETFGQQDVVFESSDVKENSANASNDLKKDEPVSDKVQRIQSKEHGQKDGKKKSISQIIQVVLSVLAIILLWKAFRGDFDQAASEITNGAFGRGDATIQADTTESDIQSDSTELNMLAENIESCIFTVQNGYLGEYTDMTIEEMLDAWYGPYYNEMQWTGGTTDDGKIVVEFKAQDTENGNGFTQPAHVQFTMYDEQIFRVSGYDNGDGKEYEPAEIGCDLNYIYYNAHMLLTDEADRDNEFQKLVEKFNGISGNAVLYGASAVYSGNRSELGEKYYGEAPLEMNARELMDYYYDNMFSLAITGDNASENNESINEAVDIYGVYSYDNGTDAVIRAEVGVYTDDDNTYLSMSALSYGDRYLAYFDGILEPVEANTYRATDENFGTQLMVTFDVSGMLIEVTYMELEECGVFDGYYEKESDINLDEVG